MATAPFRYWLLSMLNGHFSDVFDNSGPRFATENFMHEAVKFKWSDLYSFHAFIGLIHSFSVCEPFAVKMEKREEM